MRPAARHRESPARIPPFPRVLSRSEVEAAIELAVDADQDEADRLIAILDQADVDADLEPSLSALEPSWAYGDPGRTGFSQENWAEGDRSDLEKDPCDDPMDDDDRESDAPLSAWKHQTCGWILPMLLA